MQTSKLFSWLSVLLVIALPASADDIMLKGDARLSGTIRAINDSGVVELSSLLSPESILLTADAVEKVVFSKSLDQSKIPSALVKLSNGDRLPANLVDFDGNLLTVTTASAGRLVIPRADLSSLQFGIFPQKVIYAGPNNAEEWKEGIEGKGSWRFEHNRTLVANGAAYSTKTFDAPERFVLRLSLKWQTTPNFQVYFADPLKNHSEASDRYYLQFTDAGLELKRESSSGNHFTTLIISNRSPDEFLNHKINLEIRVDRKSSRLQLYINGELEGTGVDSLGHPPEGKGITLVSNVPDGNEQVVSAIEVQQLGDNQDRQHPEVRSEGEADSMISGDDDHWSGKLLSVKPGKEGLVFSFKCNFQESPLELLERDVSTIFFEKNQVPKQEEAKNLFELQLRDIGLLQLSSCSFTEDSVDAIHPLLGHLKIARQAIIALEHIRRKPKQESEK